MYTFAGLVQEKLKFKKILIQHNSLHTSTFRDNQGIFCFVYTHKNYFLSLTFVLLSDNIDEKGKENLLKGIVPIFDVVMGSYF